MSVQNELVDAYAKMYLIRSAEEVIANHYLENKIFSFVHFYTGQEAIAVGICNNLDINDRVFGNHRSHGHYLAKGGDLGMMYSEMLGKANGCCSGKGGSMHMLDKKVNFMGTTPILASISPIAAVSAFEQKFHNSENFTTFFIGDGATEEGVFYETLNIASLFNLKLLIIIENNLYSVNSPINSRRPTEFDNNKLCASLGLGYFSCNGNDYVEVSRTAKKAITEMKLKSKPVVIECFTYREMAHSSPLRDDNLDYRKTDTKEIRTENDCLSNLRPTVMTLAGESTIVQIENEIDEKIINALDMALKSPEPTTNQLEVGLYLESN